MTDQTGAGAYMRTAVQAAVRDPAGAIIGTAHDAAQYVRDGSHNSAAHLDASRPHMVETEDIELGAFSPSGERLSKQHSLPPTDAAFHQGPRQGGLTVSEVHDYHASGEAGAGFEDSTTATESDGTKSEGGDSIETGEVPTSGYGKTQSLQEDVILRTEIITDHEIKNMQLVVHFAILCGLGLMAVGIYFKASDSDVLYRTDKVQILNVSFGALCLLLNTTGLARVSWRVYVANRKKRRWSQRRKVACTLGFLENGIQWVNLVFLLVPNIYTLIRHCAWFSKLVLWSALVRWTCWNSIFVLFLVHGHSGNPWRKDEMDSIVMDAPASYHWPKAVLWLAVEGVLVALSVYLQGTGHWDAMGEAAPGVTNCRLQHYTCSGSKEATTTLTSLVTICVAIYFLTYFWHVNTTFAALKAKPYKEFRIGNIITRLQFRLRAMAIGFFVANMAVYFYVGYPSCSSFAMSWLGLLPMQVVMTAVGACWSFLACPKNPGDNPPILQVWLQEFAWTEADKPRRVLERGGESACPQLRAQPMFCFETALKAYYWSMLVYDYQQVDSSPFVVETALRLSGCEHYQLFWEAAQDTKVLVAWGEHNIVVAFRGTASMANVMADIQIWRVPHPPVRGNFLLGTRPLVHQGFLKCWTANGLNQRVIECVSNAVLRSGGAVKVHVTGHSLGGALATLAAIDIRAACPGLSAADILCYTFGAPRTGNHAFARAYNQEVPDTWHIINDQDVVARGAKFVLLYKRPGHRVLLNSLGDMVVRPSTMEISVLRVPGGSSVKQHLLTQYSKALLAVCLAQIGQKRFKGGTKGLLALVERGAMRELLSYAGLDAAAVRRWARWGGLLQVAPDGSRASRLTSRRSTGSGTINSLQRMALSGSKERSSALEAVQEAMASNTEQPLSVARGPELAAEPDVEQGIKEQSSQGPLPCAAADEVQCIACELEQDDQQR